LRVKSALTKFQTLANFLKHDLAQMNTLILFEVTYCIQLILNTP